MAKKITNYDKLDSIVENLINKVEEAGSWIKPFKSAIQGGMPINGVTNKEYRGINVFTLWATAMEKGYTSNKWFTFNQLKAKKQTVIKGEKSTQIFFFKPLVVDDKDKVGEKKTIFMLKAYNVFNIEQTDIEIPVVEVVEPTENEVIDNAKEFFDNLDYLEVNEHPQPHYQPLADTIGMPNINDFVSADEYYSTFGHEYIHSTMHKDRCNRVDTDKKTKKENYAFEELVAEIGSIFVMARLGLASEPIQDNSSAYLKGWLRALQDDKKMLWRASSQAHKAFEFLDNCQYDESENEEAQTTLEVA